MLEDASNRELLDAWRHGDHHAATILVRRYMARLTALASSRLSRKLARRVDAEDVVLSAWRSFFAASGRNQVDVPTDDNLWPLLVTMTLRKLSRQAARHSAERRSIHSETQVSDASDWPEIAARDPSPTEAAMISDDIEHLMSGLSATDREILVRRLQGEQHASIANSVDCSERTVRRSLQRIRSRYLSMHESEDSTPADPIGTDVELTESSFLDIDRSSEERRNTLQEQASPALTTPTADYSDVIIQQLVGQGAFGKVYRATRRSDGATVAVKYLRRSLWKNSQAAAQLIREVAIVSALSHPGIFQHMGWGRTDRGAVFVIMEWVDGSVLDVWLQSSTPTFGDVVQCGISVCDALSATHEAGVVHSDITPRNILRRADGAFLLTDFGFSQMLNDPVRIFSAGTPGYLAPEQLSDAFGTVSPRTDVFGIGGVLYFLLTGRPPTTGRDVPETIARTLSARPIASVDEIVPDVPARLEQLITACLSKESSSRPETIDAVKRNLCLIRSQLAAPDP